MVEPKKSFDPRINFQGLVQSKTTAKLGIRRILESLFDRRHPKSDLNSQMIQGSSASQDEASSVVWMGGNKDNDCAAEQGRD